MKHYKIISYSDVITNSSSEVFVIHSKPEFQGEINEEIPELLNQICDAVDLNINKMMEFDVSNETYIDEDWYYYVHKGDLLIYSVSDNTIPYWLMDLIDSINYLPKFKDKFSGYYAKDLGKKDLPYHDWNHKPNEPALTHKEVEIPSIQRKHLG